MEKSCSSHESHFEVHGRKSKSVRRSVGEPLNTLHILQAPKHPPKKMFRGCFTLNGTGRICPSKKMMNSTKYLEILEKTWFQLCENHSQMAMVFFSKTMYHAYNVFYQQDNDFQKNANIFLKVEIT